MNRCFFTGIVFFLFISLCAAQDRDELRGEKKHYRKIKELERIKLIESLDLDEKTAVQFFSRRKEHEKKIEKLFESKDIKLNEMEKRLEKTSGSELSEDYKKLNKELSEIETALLNERNNFFSSLDDILTPRQICKLHVFERNFKQEIRKLLFKGRRKDR